MKTELGERTRRFVSSAFAWLFPCVIIVLAVFDDNRILGSALLLTLLNGVFLTAVSLFTATLAFIGYIRVGAWRLLILSAGSVIFGLTPLLSALVMDSFGANVSVTIYNTGALLTAICFTLVIIKFSWTTAIDENPGRRMAAAAITLFSTISVTGLIAYLSMERILPPFFIQGYGSTPIREVTLGLVIVLFGYVGLQVYRDYQDSKSSFNYWFAIGLFCAASGFAGAYMTNTIGNALNWVSRFAIYAGNLCLLAAAIKSMRTAHAKSKAMDDFALSLFQESGLDFRFMMDTDPNGITVINEHGLIIRWNRRAELLFGYTGDEAFGSSLIDLIFKDHRDGIEKALKSLREQPGAKQSTYSSEMTARCKNGQIRAIDFSLSGNRAKNRWIGVAILCDITERKDAEAKIARLASFPELNPNPVLELDDAGHIIYANPYVLKQFPDLMDLDKQHPFLIDIEDCLQNGINQQICIQTMVDDRWFEQTLQYVAEIPSYHIYARDITLSKQADETIKRHLADLEASNIELEAFAYALSHDLRAPLRTLDGFSQAVVDDYGDLLDAKGKDFLLRIRGAAQHMALVTEGMLKLSRVTRADMQMESFPLGEAAEKIVRMLNDREPEKVELVIDPTIVAVGDPTLLEIALFNVLENAWKFTRKSPQARIEFGVRPKDNQAVYFVKDNGIGFDMKYYDKLFQPFQRLHNNKDYTGTGIGLATVQRVVKRHGGSIWAESEPGKGTTIYFTLTGLSGLASCKID